MNPLRANPLKSLFGRAEVTPRPDLAEFAGGTPGPRMLLVDAATPPAAEAVIGAFPGAVLQSHGPDAREGLPILEDDGRRLPATPAIIALTVFDHLRFDRGAISDY